MPSGEKRLCRVLEAAEGYALVQLFESAAGLSAETCRVRFAGRGMVLPASPGLLGRVFDGLGRPIDGGPPLIPDKVMDVNGTPMNPAARRLSGRIHPDRHFRHRRAEYPGARAKAAHLFRQRACRMRVWRRRLRGRPRCGAQTRGLRWCLPQSAFTFEAGAVFYRKISKAPARWHGRRYVYEPGGRPGRGAAIHTQNGADGGGVPGV